MISWFYSLCSGTKFYYFSVPETMKLSYLCCHTTGNYFISVSQMTQFGKQNSWSKHSSSAGVSVRTSGGDTAALCMGELFPGPGGTHHRVLSPWEQFLAHLSLRWNFKTLYLCTFATWLLLLPLVHLAEQVALLFSVLAAFLLHLILESWKGRGHRVVF